MNLSIDKLHPMMLNVGYAEHNADWNWKDVISPFMRIFYITEGEAQIVFPSGIQTLKPNYVYFIPSFTKHSYCCDSVFCLYYLHIYEEYQHEIGLLDEWDMPAEIEANDLVLPLFRRLCDMNPNMKLPMSNPAGYDNNSVLVQNIMNNKRRPFHAKVESRGIVFQLLSYFLKYAGLKHKEQDTRIEKSIDYIRKHIDENITLDDLCDEVCLSKDYFIRLFKQETACTPLQYINRRKIEKAQLILATDNIPIKNIAMALSFEDCSYFNRMFKKFTGMSPQAYRKSIQ